MSDAAYLDDAREWARQMTLWESRGPGDLDPAMRRLARRHRLPYGKLWALRYRPPKDLLTSVYFRLAAAYEAERLRQIGRLHDDAQEARAAGDAGRAVRQAEALVAQAHASGLIDEGRGEP